MRYRKKTLTIILNNPNLYMYSEKEVNEVWHMT